MNNSNRILPGRVWLGRIGLGLLCLTLLSVAPGYAEDIDIYARPPSSASNPNLNPNVLIVIDNSANWASNSQHWPNGAKQGESELRAVRNVISELDATTNVGLMMFTAGGGSNKNGGYIRFHIRPMNATNKSAFSELIGFDTGCTDGLNSLNLTPNCILKNFNSSTEKVASAKTDYSAAMLDVFKYFGGHTEPFHAGDNVAGLNVNSSQFGKQRYAGDPDLKSDKDAYTTDTSKLSYISPLSDANNCSKNYVIFIGNGFPSQDSPSTLLGPRSLLPGSGVGGDVTQLPWPNLATTTASKTELVATAQCGTYPGATATASLNACNADTTLSTQFPGYSSFSCTSNASCTAGSTTTSTTLLGTSSCGLYSTQAACAAALPSLYPGYTSYSCSSGTACSASSANPSNPIVASTACISDNLNSAASCTAYGNTNYPNYSGFSCTKLSTTCDPKANVQWRIDAVSKLTTGNTYSMFGTSTTTVSGTSFSQYINGTYTTTAAEPNGTFSAPTSVNYFDEWAQFLNQTDVSSAAGKQNINTFTIDVFKDQQDVNETKLLITAAKHGGGKYFKASNEEAIKNALLRIFSEIQSVNSVFASSSLPVSVNTQGTYLNQVFMGMFRPEGSASPRWPGNLKQYKFKLFNGVLRLSDKNGDEAISSSTGFVTPCADSFWTTDTGSYWNFGGSLALGSCSAQSSAFPAANSTSIYSDGPDGQVVEKGGAAQRLRGVSSSGSTLVSSSTNYAVCTGTQTPATTSCRKLLTCDNASCTTLTNFEVANTAIKSDGTGLNLTDTTTRDSLIDWVRGKDVDNENANLDISLVPITNEMRPSVHGGVVHSQPAVIDYGGTTGTVAFYGADDGVFHAVDGGQTDADGFELWGFIAPESFRKLNRLRVNSPPIAYPGVAGANRKDYFFDGAIGVYQQSGKVWIYPSMRRGGRAIYAFDVSIPANPILKWRKGCFTSDTKDDSSCTSDEWKVIGQTWSSPQVVNISGSSSPVLIFGGGYDQCEDGNSQNPCSAISPRKGANIWFVDANNGNIIRTYSTNYSVVGDLAVVQDANKNVTHVYASDTGGNVYRINVGSISGATPSTSWSSNSAASSIIIASLSETGQARKFTGGPSVVQSSGFNAVLLGSGDREHPLVTDYACASTTRVTNQFYMLMDKPAGYPSPVVTATALVDVSEGTTSALTEGNTTTITNVSRVGALRTSSTKGWRFNFASCEQTVNEALTIAGTTFFGTNTPGAAVTSSCSANLGEARGYAVDYLTGNPITTIIGAVVNNAIDGGASRYAGYLGGGMPPSPVAGVVDVDGVNIPFCIGCICTGISCPGGGGQSALQGGKVTIKPPASRFRSYWYMEVD